MGTNIFKLNQDGNYQIVDYIKSDDEIDLETTETISNAFNESMMNRISSAKANGLPVADSDYQKFLAYNTFAEQCRSAGRANKTANAAALALLKEVDLPQGLGEPIKIMVRD